MSPLSDRTSTGREYRLAQSSAGHHPDRGPYPAAMPPRDDGQRSRHRIPAQRQRSLELPPQDPDLDSYMAALAPDAASGGPAPRRVGAAQRFALRLPGFG